MHATPLMHVTVHCTSWQLSATRSSWALLAGEAHSFPYLLHCKLAACSTASVTQDLAACTVLDVSLLHASCALYHFDS